MNQKFKQLEREQIKRKLDWLHTHQEYLLRPGEGWIRSVRKVLGMTASHVAKRLGVTESRIFELEKSEINDATTLKTMRAVAEVMGCRFEYALIPQKAIDTFLEEEATATATARMIYVSHHMELEKQGLSDKEKKAQIEKMVEELLKNPKKLWE